MLVRLRSLQPNLARFSTAIQESLHPDAYYTNRQKEIRRMHKKRESPKETNGDILQSFFPRDICSLGEVCEHFHKNSSASDRRGFSTEAYDNYVAFVIDVMRDVAYQLWGLHRSNKVFGSFSHENIQVSKPAGVGEFQDILLVRRDCKNAKRLVEKEHTRKSDMFRFGCVFYFCLSGGVHPFGDAYEEFDHSSHEMEIDFSPIKHIPEAEHLIPLLLNPKPKMRPSARKVLQHPLFMCTNFKHLFVEQFFDLVKRGEPKLITALKSEMPKIVDESCWNVYFCLSHSNALSEYPYLLQLQSLYGPCPYTGYFAELMIKVYKAFLAAEKENMTKEIPVLRFDRYRQYFPYYFSRFPYAEV